MLRRLFRISIWVSALCLLCGAVLWPVSYYRGSGASWFTGRRQFHAEFLHGRVLLVSQPTTRGASFQLFAYIADPALADWSYTSAHVERNTVCGGMQVDFSGAGIAGQCLSNPRKLTLYVPLSYLTLIGSILPAIALRRRLRRRRPSRAFPIEPAPQAS